MGQPGRSQTKRRAPSRRRAVEFAKAASLSYWFAVASACPSRTGDVPDAGAAVDDGGAYTALELCRLDNDCGDVSCCDGACIDTQGHPSHCGTCGFACDVESHCATGSICTPMQLNAVCANERFELVLTGAPVDDLSARELGIALSSSCPAASLTEVDANESGLLDGETGQPRIAGGTTLVLAGGGFFQDAVGWLEEAGVTPVYFERSLGSLRFRARIDGRVVAQIAETDLSPSRDVFVVQLATEPDYGALALIVYGFDGAGTRAATWHFIHAALGNVDDDDIDYGSLRWYVGEWRDADGDGQVGNEDSFTILGHSP